MDLNASWYLVVESRGKPVVTVGGDEGFYEMVGGEISADLEADILAAAPRNARTAKEWRENFTKGLPVGCLVSMAGGGQEVNIHADDHQVTAREAAAWSADKFLGEGFGTIDAGPIPKRK